MKGYGPALMPGGLAGGFDWASAANALAALAVLFAINAGVPPLLGARAPRVTP